MGERDLSDSGSARQRSDLEIITDSLDREIADLYLAAGLFEADDEAVLNRDRALKLMRAALVRGLMIARENPDIFKQMTEELREEDRKNHAQGDT